jgi:hypothetical protein
MSVAMEISLGQYACPFVPWKVSDGHVFDAFAFDCETTAIDEERKYLTPAYVVGTACDGRRGVFVHRDNVLSFFQAHAGIPVSQRRLRP